MFKTYTIDAKKRISTQCNLGLAKVKLRVEYGTEDVPLNELISQYHSSAGIRRHTPPSDIAFEHFFRTTQRLQDICAAMEWNKIEGTPDMTVVIRLNIGVSPEDIMALVDIHNCGYKVFQWYAHGGANHLAISLKNIPDDQLTDFLELVREMAMTPGLEFCATAASPLTWTE